MKELIDKISTYNLFNYFLPGCLLALLSCQITRFDLRQDNLLIAAFWYYFLGMTVSRVGSLIVEPILRSSRFVKFSRYKDFVAASSKDEKIELLSEIGNTYRTLVAMLALLLSLRGYDWLSNRFDMSDGTSTLIGVVIALLLFLFAYRKQSEYINKRIGTTETT